MHQKLRSSLWLCLLVAVLLSACKKDSELPQLFPMKENSRWGYMDASGEIVVAPAYDYAWDFSGGMGRFKDKGKYGFINAKGEVVIAAAYAYAADFVGGYARINIKDTTVADVQYDGYNLDSDWTFTDPYGVVFNQTFARVENFKNGVAAVKDQDDYSAPYRYATVVNGQLDVQDHVTAGVFNFNGHILAPASDSETGKLGMIDKGENWVVQPSFDELQPYSEGLAAAKKNNQYGYIDLQGNWIYSRAIPINQYAYLSSDFPPFSNGLAAVKTGTDAYQYINKTGGVAIKTRFKNAGAFSADGYAIVTVDAGTGLIDTQGNWAIKPNLNIQSVFNGVAIYFNERGLSGARDIKTQKDVIPPVYSSITRTGNLLRVLNTGAAYGYINDRGQFVIQPQYNSAWTFSQGKAMVNVKDDYFYVDASGRNVGKVPADRIPDGVPNTMYASASNDGTKYGYFKNGEPALPGVYDFATDFEGAIARVNMGAATETDAYEYKGGQWGLIDEQGKSVMAPRYSLIMPFNNGLALINNGGSATYMPCMDECDEAVYYSCNGGTWGLLKADGKESVKPQYDQLVPFGKNYLAATGKQWSIIDGSGKTVYAGPIEIDVHPGSEDELFDPEAPTGYADAEYVIGHIPHFENYRFIEARENGLTGIITPEGKWLLKPLYDNVLYNDATAASPFTEGKVRVKVDSLWGAADASGELVVMPQYTGIRNFVNGYAPVRNDAGRWGFINESNAVILEAAYANVRNIQGNVVIVQEDPDSPEHVVDLKGKEIIAPTAGVSLAPEGFVNGVCVLSEEKNGATKKTLITESGKRPFAQMFSDMQVYPGLVYVSLNEKWAMATPEGRLLTGFDYTWLEPYHNQAWIRCNTGGELYYDEHGEQPWASAFGGLWGVLDKTGKLRVPMAYAEIGEFGDDLAPARSGKDLDEVGYFDTTGKVVREVKK